MHLAKILGASLVFTFACAPSGSGGGGGGGGGSVDAGGGGDNDGGNGGGPGGNGGNGGDGGGGEVADAAPEPTCGEQQEDIEAVNGAPPDLLIVLDRSGSMNQPVNLFTTRWQVMSDALATITAAHDDAIRFGLSIFPTDNACALAPGTAVGIGDGTAGAIATWLAGARRPNGNTPAHLALDNALEVYGSVPVNPDGRYVLFATDGIPNCGPRGPSDSSNPEVIAAVEALAAQDIKTFVLGFGPTLGLDVTNLNAAALAGGVPKPGGPPHYYLADNATDLEAALEAIAGGIIVPSCEYELATLPPDPDAVTVTMDGTPVPRSPSQTDGWEYHPDASHVTFFGSYCDMLTNGAVTNVRFTYGCPGPVID